MQRWLVVPVGLFALLVATVPATVAHPHEYFLAADTCVKVTAGSGGGQIGPGPCFAREGFAFQCQNQPGGLAIGMVCLGDDVVPNIDGEATLTVFDDFFQPVAAVVCQHHGQNPPDDLVGSCGGGGRLFVPFCGEVTISVNDGWEFNDIDVRTSSLVVYLVGPVLGNAIFGICSTIASPATHGFVNHFGG